MKIIKNNKLDEAVLNINEANENAEINPMETTDSVQEIANNYQDQAAAADVNVSDKEAEEVAEVGKDIGNKINSDEILISAEEEDVPLPIFNRLTKTLDLALGAALRLKKKHSSERANVLVSGLPGSSKTASIYNWAALTRVPGKDGSKDENDKIHIVYINAKNNDLDAFINGYTVQDPEDKLSVRQAVSHNLDGLDQPNSILFIDELNRQTKSQIRGSLLTLINEHYVVGKEVGGKHYFNNFLFTIAAINPGGTMEDEGAAKLNDAEKTRYLFKVTDFDSDPKTTLEYIDKYYTSQFNKEIKAQNPDWDEIEKILRAKDLGRFIVSNKDFKYDDKTKLNTLYLKDKTMLNQRTLTAGLETLGWDVDLFKDWLQNSSDFLEEDINMLLNILDDYIVIPFNELLRQENSPKLPQQNKDTEPENNENNGENEKDQEDTQENGSDDEDDDLEDDEDFFNKTNSTSEAETPDEIKKRIVDILNSWTI